MQGEARKFYGITDAGATSKISFTLVPISKWEEKKWEIIFIVW